MAGVEGRGRDRRGRGTDDTARDRVGGLAPTVELDASHLLP